MALAKSLAPKSDIMLLSNEELKDSSCFYSLDLFQSSLGFRSSCYLDAAWKSSSA